MKRSRRLREKKEQEPVQELIPQDWQRGANTKGLAILPDELLLEILAYYPPISLPTLSDDRINTAAHIARRDMMLALSRSCSNLRRFFHPYIWERIEVCAGMSVRFNGSQVNLHFNGHPDMDKAFAEELIRQLEIVTVRDPTLAQYVKIANIRLSKFAIHRVLIELGRCFDLFTNLHTAKIVFLDDGYHNPTADTGSQRAFRKHTYPNVQKLILSEAAFPLLQSCPNVRMILPYGRIRYLQGQWKSLLDYTGKCSKVEQLLLRIADSQISILARGLPSLTEVDIDISARNLDTQDILYTRLEAISQFPRLDKISVDFQLEANIKKWLLGILRTVQEKDGRRKCLSICGSESYINPNKPAPKAPVKGPEA